MFVRLLFSVFNIMTKVGLLSLYVQATLARYCTNSAGDFDLKQRQDAQRQMDNLWS